MHRCERGRVGNVLNSVVFPLRSTLFTFKSIDIPHLNFPDLNSYSAEISSQNKLFNMYVVEKKSNKRFLMQNFPPGMF